MKKVLLIALSLSWFTAYNASADVFKLCNSCSDYNMKVKAKSVARGEGVYDVNVVDFTNVIVKKYTVTRRADEEVGYIDYVREGSPSTEVKTAVGDLKAYVQGLAHQAISPIAIERIAPFIQAG